MTQATETPVRTSDGYYRFPSSNPPANTVRWGTPHHWARVHRVSASKQMLESILRDLHPSGPSVRDGGTDYRLYPEEVVIKAVEELKKRLEKRNSQRPGAF